MKRLRDLLIDGLLVALPLALVAVLLAHALNLVAKVTTPLAKKFPEHTILGVALSEIFMIAGLLGAIMVIGLFVRSGTGHRVKTFMERVALHKVPGFLLFKSMAISVTGADGKDESLVPVLVDFDDNTVLAFLVEASGTTAGLATVFVPSAPTPAAGMVLLVEPRRIRKLGIPLGAAMRTITTMGLGTQTLLKNMDRSKGTP